MASSAAEMFLKSPLPSLATVTLGVSPPLPAAASPMMKSTVPEMTQLR